MDDRKDSTKQENSRPDPVNSGETLEKLALLEEKLKILHDFTEQSLKIRETRKQLVENLINLSSPKQDKTTIAGEKRVKFSEEEAEDKRKELKRMISKRDSASYPQMLNRSKSIHELLLNLHTWHGEINRRKSEIQALKAKKMSFREEKALELDIKIIKLENEKDELDEKVLHFVLQNIDDNKQDYKELIIQLEIENKEMEDRMDMLQRRVEFLKDTNIALMFENEQLRRAACRSSSSVVLALEKKYRESTMVGANNFGSFCCDMPNSTSSEEYNLNMEDDEFSVSHKSEDSFQLDKQIATWKTDDASLLMGLRRLEDDLHGMKVTQMKLDMVKRYVLHHGTKSINRHTFIDSSTQKMSLYR
uniref:Uncharacterized protein n=1 Tax=Graphocephala atropunctata TaxID=36148 RepID=A0A1B6MPD4_9HEMI